jgi:hypothetical protein
MIKISTILGILGMGAVLGISFYALYVYLHPLVAYWATGIVLIGLACALSDEGL